VPWLVKGLLPQTGTALIPGQWGLAKTYVLTDLSASISTGAPFAGHRVTDSP
jgi:hypothetical protein